MAAVDIDGKLYVVGGYRRAWPWQPVANLWRYDPSTNRWEARRPMPTARGALAVGVINGKLYAVGGMADRVLNVNEEYDPVTDTWRKRAPMPTARDHLAAAALDGKLYAVGGRVGTGVAMALGENLAVTEVYDPDTDRWDDRRPMPTARGGIAAVALGGRLFVFGGEESAGTFAQTEAYDAGTDRWTTLAPMPTARHGLGAAAVGGRIYVIGGGGETRRLKSALNEVFDPWS
ncbi:MAG: galactose oxidase [Candidatus Methylomirabilis sp.]|nr:galactose oxidase [Candidatus Methylomirabilis sp.]